VNARPSLRVSTTFVLLCIIALRCFRRGPGQEPTDESPRLGFPAIAANSCPIASRLVAARGLGGADPTLNAIYAMGDRRAAARRRSSPSVCPRRSDILRCSAP